MGGLVAAEAIKGVSGQFIPISQFLFFDAFNCLPEELPCEEEREIRENNRFNGQVLIFGNKIQDLIEKRREFVVGAGALGMIQ